MGSSARVLVVDDDSVVLRAVSRTLELAGFEVKTATSAMEALSVVEDGGETIMAVVCDYSMAEGPSTELLSWLSERHPKVGRVLLTGYPSPDVDAASEAADVYRVLSKPWSSRELVSAIWGSVFYQRLSMGSRGPRV